MEVAGAANWSPVHNAYLPGKSRSMRADGAPKSYGNHKESNPVKAKTKNRKKNCTILPGFRQDVKSWAGTTPEE